MFSLFVVIISLFFFQRERERERLKEKGERICDNEKGKGTWQRKSHISVTKGEKKKKKRWSKFEPRRLLFHHHQLRLSLSKLYQVLLLSLIFETIPASIPIDRRLVINENRFSFTKWNRSAIIWNQGRSLK